VRDTFFFEECSFSFESFGNWLDTIEIELSRVVWHFCGVLPCFIDGGSDKDSLFFGELVIHITKFWCFVSDASTIRVGDKISVIHFEGIFKSFFIIYSFCFIILVAVKWSLIR
jgi:hypothetical protein